METIVGNAICADGAAAVVLSYPPPGAADGAAVSADRNRAPRIVAFQSVLDPGHLDKVGFAQREGKLRIILAAEIRDLAGPIIERCLEGLLTPHGLRREDVRFWILHPGGRKVLDAVAQHLSLREDQLLASRHILRNFGNMSSPTVLFVLNEVLRSGAPQPGDYGVLLALGPGFAAEAALLRW
jgi:alkylresorcinol/alkylpyrone synthase